jgi:hypothetical protein
MGIAAISAALAAKKALENVIDDAYQLGKDQLGKQIKAWRTKAKIDTLYKKLKDVRRVKTIWQAEKEVDLMDFYYPSKIKVGEEEKVIRQLEDLNYQGNVVVEGTIGQGKSIFFRYLTSQEMLKGKAIPLFVELRRIRENETIVDHLVDEVQSLGLQVDSKTLLFLAQHGKVILFLDAFDEVSENRRASLITEIERLIKRYDKLRVLISSRPHSGIAASPLFRVFKLCPLAQGEYENVIPCMVKDQKQAREITKIIEHSKKGISRLLTTPLMVALVVVRYRMEQTIPETAIAFYDGLFDLLLVRHDKTKPGYKRPRQSKLGDSALRRIFNGICFLTRKADKGILAKHDLQRTTQQAIRIAQLEADEDAVLADIIRITCLILEEGGECKFIHKSVQEYHAACFVKERPDELAARFYKKVRNRWRIWEQELDFLEQMDTYRYYKDFLIPDIMETLGFDTQSPASEWEPSSEQIRLLTDITALAFTKGSPGTLTYISTTAEYSLSFTFNKILHDHFVRGVLHMPCSALAKEIANKDSPLSIKTVPGLRGTRDVLEVRLSNIVETGYMVDEVTKTAKAAFVTAHSELLRCQEYVDQVEATKSIFDLGNGVGL